MDGLQDQERKSLQKVRQRVHPLKNDEKNNGSHMVQEDNKIDIPHLRQIPYWHNSQITVVFPGIESQILLQAIPPIQI